MPPKRQKLYPIPWMKGHGTLNPPGEAVIRVLWGIGYTVADICDLCCVTDKTVVAVVNRPPPEVRAASREAESGSRSRSTSVKVSDRRAQIADGLGMNDNDEETFELALDVLDSVKVAEAFGVSVRTIQRDLLEMGLPYKNLRPGPDLDATKCELRMAYAQRKDEITKLLPQLFWSDECILRANDVRRGVRRRKSSGRPRKAVRRSAVRCHVWGWVNADGDFRIFKFNAKGSGPRGGQTGVDYQKILVKSGIKDALNKHPGGGILQQDNCGIHGTPMNVKWFEKHKVRRLLNWPPNSPDQNPIENVWALLKRLLGKARFAKMKERDLWVHAQACAKKLSGSDQLKNIVASVPRRMEALAAANGSFTKY